MKPTQKYMEMLREKLAENLGCEKEKIKNTDLMKLLNLPSGTISRYVTGTREADDQIAMEIAHYVQIPPMQIIGEIKAEQSKDKEAKKWWLEQSKKAVGAFGAVCLVSGILLTTPNEAKAEAFKSNKKQSIYYTNLSNRRHKHWLIICFRNFVSVITHEIRRNNNAYI